jgi:hypothetical protein
MFPMSREELSLPCLTVSSTFFIMRTRPSLSSPLFASLMQPEDR